MKDTINKYLLGLLSKKDYCSYDLKKKALLKFNNETEIDSLIKDYINKGYINDNEYLDKFVKNKLSSYHSIKFCYYKLNYIGYKNINLDKYKQIEKQYLNKFVKINIDVDKVKLVRRLLTKGYELNDIKEATDYD